MILSDYHVHTVYCDGNDTPRDMVLSAIDKGMSEIGILAHSFTPFDKRYCIQEEKIQAFIREISELKVEFKDKIKVLCGVEQDYFSKNISGFDYKIGSVHYVLVDGKYLEIDESEDITKSIVEDYFDGDWYALCEEYFNLASDVLNKTNADIIGHFDLITKFNKDYKYFDESNPRYVKAYRSAIDKLIVYNKLFEINTGAIYKGFKNTPYPSESIIDYIKKKGGRFILSSDSHKKESLCFSFEKLKQFNSKL